MMFAWILIGIAFSPVVCLAAAVIVPWDRFPLRGEAIFFATLQGFLLGNVIVCSAIL